MSLLFRVRPDAADIFDAYCGDFRLGVIEPIAESKVAPAAFIWAITTIVTGGRVSGSAPDLEGAKAAMSGAWEQWMALARLVPEEQLLIQDERLPSWPFRNEAQPLGATPAPSAALPPNDRRPLYLRLRGGGAAAAVDKAPRRAPDAAE
ncbi:hypothetical protein [Terrarubrum flagellatum]|uniref:hypothetical protein n=1 Tax=Terrirubrum flagellatum TaxID=2895980 RepID=UPI0031450C15